MIDRNNERTAADAQPQDTARLRAIRAYEDARGRTSETLGQAPLIALAGGLAAGALIAALLPRTDAETRLIRPTARRVKNSARAAFAAARDTGSQRLDELGISREKGEETVRGLFEGLADAAKASANAAADAVRKG